MKNPIELTYLFLDNTFPKVCFVPVFTSYIYGSKKIKVCREHSWGLGVAVYYVSVMSAPFWDQCGAGECPLSGRILSSICAFDWKFASTNHFPWPRSSLARWAVILLCIRATKSLLLATCYRMLPAIEEVVESWNAPDCSVNFGWAVERCSDVGQHPHRQPNVTRPLGRSESNTGFTVECSTSIRCFPAEFDNEQFGQALELEWHHLCITAAMADMTLIHDGVTWREPKACWTEQKK